MKQLLKIFWIALVVKLLISALLPLTTDEAYYWVWSHHFQLSYYDHPAMIAGLFGLGRIFEQVPRFLSGMIRWPAVLMSQATLWIWILILKDELRFTIPQLKIWLWLALLSPLFGAGALIITPDIPMLFFWSLTLWLFLKWEKSPGWRWAFLLGLSCGLGFASKYVMILEPFFLFIYCLITPRLRKPALVWAVAILLGVIAGSSPVWIWNMNHQWISFKFQMHHGLGHTRWKPSWTYMYVLGQIAILFPTIIYWSFRGAKKSPWWLLLLAFGPVLLFGLTSFRGNVEANWPIAAYPAIFAVTVLALDRMDWSLRATLGLWTAFITIVFFVVVTGWPSWSQKVRTREFHRFDILQAQAKELSPVFARSYQMAAKLSFDTKKQIYKLAGMNRPDFYDFLPQSEPRIPMFYVLAEKQDELPQKYLKEGYRIVERKEVTPKFFVWKVAK